MGIEGIENLKPEDGTEVQTPDTEIVHAADVNTENPDGETVEVTEEAVADEPQGTEVTEDPGDAPENVEQYDDGNTFQEPQPANPNVSEETPNA